jgi:Acetyltransferase (GNAT) domain
MQANWSIDQSTIWDELHSRVGASLQQDWAYGASMKLLGVGVLRVMIEQDGEPIALAQFLLRSWGAAMALALCSRGPVWLHPLTADDKKKAYRLIKSSLPLAGLKWVAVTPEEPLTSDLGLSSWRRVMTGAATVMLDLQAPEDQIRAGFERNWRNKLNASERGKLQVARMSPKPGAYRWLLEAEEAQRRARGLEGLPLSFFDVFMQSRKDPSATMLNYRADIGKNPVAGMIFLIHGSHATYQVGWGNDQGRDEKAHHVLLWRAICDLKALGIRQLDLGGVNTQRSATLARFKMGLGGEVRQFAGTYLL